MWFAMSRPAIPSAGPCDVHQGEGEISDAEPCRPRRLPAGNALDLGPVPMATLGQAESAKVEI